MKLDHSEKRNEKLNIIFEVICALILGSAAFCMFISMFGLRYSPGEMFAGSFSGGLAGVWNTAADKLGNLDYVILPKYDAPVSDGGRYIYGFALTVVLAAFCVISFLIVKSKIRLLMLIFVIPAAVLMLGLGLAPSAYAGVLFAAAVIIVLAVMNIKGNIRPAYFIVPLAAVLIGSGVLFFMDKTDTLVEPKALSDYAQTVKAGIDRSRYGTDPLPAGEVGALSGKKLKEERGSIEDIKAAFGMPALSETGSDAGTAANGASQDTSEEESGTGEEASGKGSDTALIVTMSEPESYYLRGFVGASYGKSKWDTLPNSTFYQMRDQLYWLNRRGFDGLSELSYASKLGGVETKDISFKVEVEKASKKNAFIPYELMLEPAEGEEARPSEMVLPSGTKNYGGSHLGTTGVTGRNEYSYTASSNITGIWTDAVGKFYTTQQNEDIARFFISESHYNVDVYEKYLDIPDMLVKDFEKEIGPAGDISANHADYKESIDIISKYLNEKYIYSEAFNSITGGSGDSSDSSGGSSGSGSGSAGGSSDSSGGSDDFVQSFIAAKRGCDVHFATLATLLFRYYGIPARYVEGYLISPANIAGAAGETSVNVPRSANHAWTEIYIDGFGWIPFEATPEYSGIMHQADLSRGLQNVDYESPQNDRIDVEEEEQIDEENEDEGDLKALLLKILKILLIILVSVILLVLAVLAGIRMIRYIKWRRAFADKDPKAGVRALYQYSAEKKWKLAKAGEELGLRASYSTEKMAEADRTAMRKEVDKAKERAKAAKQKAAAQAAGKSKVDSVDSAKQKATEQAGQDSTEVKSIKER